MKCHKKGIRTEAANPTSPISKTILILSLINNSGAHPEKPRIFRFFFVRFENNRNEKTVL
jgi:hypothetical protein